MTRKKRNTTLAVTFLALVAILQLSPLIVTLFNSFRADKEIKLFPVGLPTQFNFDNYINAWNIGGYLTAFLNSIVISLTATAVITILSMIAGFFMARYKTKLTAFLFAYFGIALSIPVFSYLVPIYFTFADLDLVNTKRGLILIYIATNIPFNVLLARTFILGVPKELDEAATIDGCTTYRLIWKIIMPVAKPVITTIALISFVTTWNEFTVSNTFLQSPELKTAATRFVLFVGERGSDLALIYTAAILTMLPIIVVFIALQNYFIDGMTAGSVK
jgi:raffinose/stachyose/melibiose transport system permease protein